MAKDYFKDCKAIINSVLDYLTRSNQYDEKSYYTIDILSVGETTAKVKVCNDDLHLVKEQGAWTPVESEDAIATQ
jgi:hypothetical protein